MKKRLVALWLVILILPACITAVYANEGYALSNQNFMPDHIYGLLSRKFQIAGEMKPVFILDHDPTQGNVEYVSWLPYDTLAEISLGWKTASVIVFNTTMNAYFLRVSYKPTISADGQLKYCALGTSNGYCYGSKATEKGDTNITTNVTINQGTSIPHQYVSTTLINSAKKTAEDVTKGLVNIMEWLDVVVDGILLTIKQIDLTNDLLYWIADNFNDMLYAIGKANLLIAEVAINQWEELIRFEDFLSAINYNQVYAYYAQGQFFTDVGSRLDTLVTNSAGIGSRLDSIISNGAVQVNTSPIEARLDKLISMYSKVNSVVLDTAAINGSKIKAAVGGELEDAIFWGNSGYSNNAFIISDATYSLNGVQTKIPVRLRGFSLGASVPASFDTSDTALMTGVWRNSGGNYRLSDTYNAATGEYVRRVGAVTYDGSEDWKMVAKDGCYLFYLSDPAFSHTNGNIFSIASGFGYVPYNSAFSGNASDSAIAYNYKFTVFTGKIMIICQSPSVAAWKTWLKRQVAAGTPWTVWYQDVPTATVLDRTTIAIPEGDSTITGDYMRITGKYETYDSYTQTADIINAINNIPPYDDSGLIAAITNMTKPNVTTDLTAVTSRLDLILAELQSTSGSASCEHIYQQRMEQEATCILPGLMISTCSQCGDNYSEIVDPLGHDWVISSHVDAVTDPDTGEETASAYDVYTCSRCGDTYNDYSGDGAPDEDYNNTSISQLVVKVFSKLGTFAGKLIGFVVHLFDKAITAIDNVVSKFNDYVSQISGFGGDYPVWLTGFWAVLPAQLQVALTFAVICMALGVVGKKLFFS